LAEPGSPQEWRDRLLKQLEARALHTKVLEDYYDGDHPLPGPPGSMQRFAEAVAAFKNLSRLGVTNYVKLIADAPAERLRVVGFRFGDTANAEADDVAWAIWQRNELDADSAIVQHSSIVTGTAFALVWPENGLAVITPEHPCQAIVAYKPGSRRQRAAGLKFWLEDDESKRCVLYLPDKVYKWFANKGSDQWSEWRPLTDNSWPIANPLPAVPLVEFRANPSLKPSLFGGGRGDFEGVLPIQDRINKTVFDRLVTAEFQAFRQRWAVGWTPDNPNEAVKAAVSRLLSFEDKDVQVGEFAQADFSGFIKGVESDVQAMAAITRTPSFYTLGQISNISGDSLTALQSGLIARTEAHRDNFTESWEEVLRLALAAEGDARATDTSSMAIWRNIEHRTWAEIADAAVKMKSINVPDEALWAMLPNVTPQDIARWKVMQADQALFAPEPPVVPALNAPA
jgi:hypothetical protein